MMTIRHAGKTQLDNIIFKLVQTTCFLHVIQLVI
jgi:hypothetical protein